MAVATVGLEDMSAHLLPRWRAWNLYQRPWVVVKQGRLMRSRTDYMLGSDLQIFHNVAVQDPRHNFGHYTIATTTYKLIVLSNGAR